MDEQTDRQTVGWLRIHLRNGRKRGKTERKKGVVTERLVDRTVDGRNNGWTGSCMGGVCSRGGGVRGEEITGSTLDSLVNACFENYYKRTEGSYYLVCYYFISSYVS